MKNELSHIWCFNYQLNILSYLDNSFLMVIVSRRKGLGPVSSLIPAVSAHQPNWIKSFFQSFGELRLVLNNLSVSGPLSRNTCPSLTATGTDWSLLESGYWDKMVILSNNKTQSEWRQVSDTKSCRQGGKTAVPGTSPQMPKLILSLPVR